tara:strand:- start:1870 stop:2532 length:663 start_codon:yes stop_codon:yes gene_type:complete
MATSVYFNNFEASMEQYLIEDLVIESIKIHGHDIYYITRTAGAVDDVLNEDDLSEYKRADFIDMYIKNFDGFEGEGDFLSKFGLEIRDEMTLTIARRTFELDVAQYTGNDRPLEGDLIYFPLNKKMFEVKFVEHEPVFYQMGALQMYDLRCEMFEYSQETFNTGVSEIDTLFAGFETTSNTSIEFLETQDSFADNSTIETAADSIIDFSEADPFSEGGRF